MFRAFVSCGANTWIVLTVALGMSLGCQGRRASLCVESVGQTSKSVDVDTPENELPTLFERAQQADRDVWWPAVQRLGRLANDNEALREQTWRHARVNSLGMKFAEVPPGTFVMGPDEHRIFSVQVAHQVRLSEGYFISIAEVTNAQFGRMFPGAVQDWEYSPHQDSPAVSISWEMANKFCELLSAKEDAVYRLPTEAEWEYACRAGTTTRYHFGDDAASLFEYASCGQQVGSASQVAKLKPNAWGIYDMHGNAFEWVSDWFTSSYYAACAAEGLVEDPRGAERGRSHFLRSDGSHVLRSGPWVSRNPFACTSTARFPKPLLERVPFDPDLVKMSQLIGFRVVRELAE